MRKTFLQSAQPKQRDEFRHARFSIGLLPLLDLETERDVLRYAHALEQRVALEYEPDVALLHGNVVHALTANKNVAIRRHFETGDHAQHRRLAATAWSEQTDEFAVVDREVDVVDGGNFAEFF